MRLNHLIFYLFLTGWTLPTFAATDCYLVAGLGQGRYKRSLTNKFEDHLLDRSWIQKTSTFKSTSYPYQLGVGCQFSRSFALEVGYLQGFKTQVNTTVAICGEIFDLSLCSKSVLLRREMTLEGWEVSGLGLLPLSQRVAFTGRLGILVGTGRATLLIPQLSKEIQFSTEKRGVIPVVGLGLMYRANPDFSLSFERKQFDGNSSLGQVVARWYF